MPNITSVSYISGALSSTVSGTVSTLDAVITSGGTASPIGLGIQGMTSGTPVPVNIMSGGTALTVTSGGLDVNIKAATGVNPNGQAVMSASAPVVIASNQSAVAVTVPLGQQVMASSTPVVMASDLPAIKGYYVACPASTTTTLQSSAGASGDYLDHVVVVPGTTAPGVVTIEDNATSLIAYPGGGTTALLTLTPFTIYVGAFSRSGAWKVICGANVTALGVWKVLLMLPTFGNRFFDDLAAQTVSGGGGGFTPASMASLTHWYDASNPSGITASGNNVTSFNDLKGSLNLTIPAGTGNAQTGLTTVNGLNVATTSSANTCIYQSASTDVPTSGTTGMAFYCVMSFDLPSYPFGAGFGYGSVNAFSFPQLLFTPSFIEASLGNGNVANAGVGTTFSGLHCIKFEQDLGGTTKLIFDKTDVGGHGTSTTSPYFDNPSNVTLFFNYSGIGNNSGLKFCEYVICNVSNPSDETSLYNYFTAKWGVP